MATNVKPQELNYDNYKTEKYEDEIAKVIPGHKEMHKEIARLVKNNLPRQNAKILELGVGTGLTAEKILMAVPEAQYYGIDFSDAMIKGAINRLKGFKTNFIKGDFAEINLPKDNDLIISVIGIHHQKKDDDKKRLFTKIFSALKTGGIFIFGDLMTFLDKNIAALNEAKHFNHLVSNANDEESLREWAFHHKFLNSLAPTESQIEWLKEVGFKEVDVIFSKFNTVLILARR